MGKELGEGVTASSGVLLNLPYVGADAGRSQRLQSRLLASMPSTCSSSFERRTRISKMPDGYWRRKGFNKIPQRDAFGHQLTRFGRFGPANADSSQKKSADHELNCALCQLHTR